jgi:hypothetical protein
MRFYLFGWDGFVLALLGPCWEVLEDSIFAVIRGGGVEGLSGIDNGCSEMNGGLLWATRETTRRRGLWAERGDRLG